MLLKRSVPALCLQCARLYSTSTSLQPRVIYTTPNALLVKLAKVFSLSTLSVGLASVRQSHSIVILNVLSRYPRFPLLPFSTFGITLQVRYSIHHFIDQMLMHMTSSPSAGPEPVHVWRRYANETSSIRCYANTTVVCFIALIASACSTGALHYLLSPFINSIYLHQPSKGIISPNTKITLETLNIAARKRYTTVALRDLVPSSRSLLTWTVSKKALKPGLPQTRFWLDTRNGVGDQEAMSSIVQIIKDGRQRTRVM